MNAIGHQMILASAGSGKTYALTNRFVRLLALGAKPDRIVALTFTRKAAGEFFDEILTKLADAATSATAAQRLAQGIEFPQLTSEDFLTMLRAVVDAMPRLRLGTFDGFFARIARSFPIELGLAGEFEILQEHAARRERARVLQRMFSRAGDLTSAQTEFIEAFKRATFGSDEKQLGARLDRLLDDYQEVFLAAPAAERWGNPGYIWPAGWNWEAGGKEAALIATKTLRSWVEHAPITEEARRRWDIFLEQTTRWTPGGVMPLEMDYVLKKALEAWPELQRGPVTLEFFRKKQDLDAAASAALAELVRRVVGGEISRQLEITRGFHAVLLGYEAVYHDAVRRAGKLTFGDVQRLLAPQADGGGVLSRVAENDGRLFIDFRLDAEIDHWLLDEFQDTSFGQWSVLKNLVDEAVQDASRARSFFYVGDIKQAIFAWREGDPRLFREIFDQYNSAQTGLIEEHHLLRSYRSGPPIIAMVNRVFGDALVMADLFPGEASNAWNREWKNHETAKPELGGQVALLHADDEEARFALTLRLLHEIEPLERGLTCAVLVQKNDTAARLADYLRREGGLPAAAESDLHVCTDNPLGAVLLALVKAAAFPGDSLAREHLAMTPLEAVLREEGAHDARTLTRLLLGQLHAEGFERTMDHWLRKLLSRLEADDAFSRERGKQFVAAAGLFDATGSRDIAEFIEFMERYTLREVDPASVIRVMTIHKSKGLGFDLVMLPDLEGEKLAARRKGLAIHRTPDRTVDWVLDLPSKLFASQDPVLAEHVSAAEAEACYESLSLLYVAMTRAKRAMYVMTKPPGRSKSLNFPRLLADTLGEDSAMVKVGKLELIGSYTEGDDSWFERLSKPEVALPVRTVDTRMSPSDVVRSKRLPARRPSESQSGQVSGSRFFTQRITGEALELGRAVHGFLAEVEWADPNDIQRLSASWFNRGEASDLAIACLNAPELSDLWVRRPRAEVWRERMFETVLDGNWITGIFDRVVIEYSAEDRAQRATVFDFKTDADESFDARRYESQLQLYRRAAAQLAGLPVESVECELVLVRARRRLKMAARSG